MSEIRKPIVSVNLKTDTKDMLWVNRTANRYNVISNGLKSKDKLLLTKNTLDSLLKNGSGTAFIHLKAENNLAEDYKNDHRVFFDDLSSIIDRVHHSIENASNRINQNHQLRCFYLILDEVEKTEILSLQKLKRLLNHRRVNLLCFSDVTELSELNPILPYFQVELLPRKGELEMITYVGAELNPKRR